MISGVYALERTTIYGTVDPYVKISLTASYINNGEEITNTYYKMTDQFGKWDFIVISDPGGIIKATIVYEDIEEEYTIPVGQIFEADILGLNAATETTESASENATENITEETQPAETTLIEEEQTQDTGITGKSIFEGINFSNFNTFFIILGLFLTVVIANLVSHGIVHLISKSNVKFGGPKVSEGVNVVKWSDKFPQKSEKELQQEIQERQKILDVQKREKERQEKIRQLQEQLREMQRS